jgi:hypothetical protein
MRYRLFIQIQNIIDDPSAGGPSPAMSLVSSNIIFYQYQNATTVGTYSLQIGQSAPVLLSSSQQSVNSIVQLNF